MSHCWCVLSPTSTGLLTCLSGLVTRNKTSPPFPCRQYNDKLSIFLIATFAFVLCVCMSPCVSLSLDVPLSFRAFCVCVCVVLCSSVEPAVCVRCTWLTCSRRAGCQQKPHHFTSPLSDSHPCQEDCFSGLKTHTGCTAGSSVTKVCVFCVYERPFVPSL